MLPTLTPIATQLAATPTGPLEYAVAGAGTPAVVLINGAGGPLAGWGALFNELAAGTRVVAYNRPGIGRSAAPDRAQEGAAVVAALRDLLAAVGVAPPYLLVGHSLGGLYLQLFARLHPDEVAGLLLIDSSHPSQMADVRGRPPHTAWTTLVNLYMTGTRGREFRALDATGREVLQAPPLEGKPVIILNAGRDPSGGEPNSVTRERLDLARLHPGSELRWIDGGHDLHRTHPQAIIDAIHELLTPRD